MPDNAPGNPPGTDPGTRGLGTEDEDSYTVVIDATSDDGSHGDGDGRGLVGVGLESNADPDSPRNDAFSVDFGDIFGDADDDELPVGDADEHQLSFGATSGAYGELDVDLSLWAPLLGMLESTEPEASPGDRPFTTTAGVEAAHALELRAESMLQYAERGAQRTGELDRTEVGVSDDNRDVVAGRDEVEIDGMLEEHTGHGLVHVADDVEMNVGGRLRVHAHLEDNIIMAGVMRDEWKGGTVVTAAMSDDMAAGLGLRCTAPLDVWVHGLMGMEERPGTCAADGILLDLAGTLYEREYGPSAHVALVARHSGTVVTTMKTGFRPLLKTALGVRNLIPGGGGGGGAASASPPAAPPAPAGGAAGGEAAGAVTLTAVESGGALGRGVAGSDDTEDIVSVARTVDNASDAAEVEDLQRAATTADNLDDLARVEIEGTGYQQVAEIYEQPIPPSAVSEPEGDELSALVNQGESLQESSDLDGTGARPLADSDNPPPLAPEQPGADPSPGADSAAPGTAASKREPPPLDLTEPGTEGYDFRKSYGSLHDRNQFYRQEMNLRGNFFMREYLGEIDAKAFELFEKLGGSADEIAIDNYGLRTSSIYDTLEQMAEEAERAGDVDRLADIRAAMEEIEELVQNTLVEVAARADEFSGAAIGSQRAPIDRNIDTEKLRSWLQDQLQQAQDKFITADSAEAAQLAGWEAAYYDQMIKMLDAGVNPLTYSNEQIAFIQINKVDAYYAQFADEVAAAAAEGWDLVIPRPQGEDELDLYVKLQELLVSTLSDPEFFRSAEDMGLDTFTQAVRARIDTGLDFLGPDSLRPLAEGEIPPPLPAADFSDSAVYVGEVRDRSFSRSTLAASEDTLQRQAAGLAEGGASVRNRAPNPGSGVPDPSLGSRRAPPDNARAPNIDERSGRWVVEPRVKPEASPAPADGASTPAQGGGVSSPASGVSWESGLQVSGGSEVGSEVGPGAGNAGDADLSYLFRAASEPEDPDPEGVDKVTHAPAANDDGSSGSPTARSAGTGSEDANPTGTVAGPDDSTTSGRGNGSWPGPSGTDSRIAPDTSDPVSTGPARSAPGTGATPSGATASDAGESAAGPRSDLYNEPVSFEGHSLEGAPRSGDSKELAQSLDRAEIPIDDLPRVEPDAAEPARKPIRRNADAMSDPGLSYRDEDDAIIERRTEYARNIRNRSNRDADTVWRRARNRKEAVDAANARWSEFASAKRTSSTSFSDDPRQLLYPIEHEATVYSRRRGRFVELYRGADPPSTIDRSHAAHFVPRPRGREPAHETGFGRLAQGWNEFPFSHRERILNTLSKGESLNPEQIAALESGLEGYRAAGGRLSSSQHRAMADMISDLGDQYRHARWHMHGTHSKRLLQLIEMLDYAAVAV